mmetsp:Transcript_44065/g.138464  ORF Transcript_44065/g.138464 Transcript_44065/m.138464 type:complete len:156 (-) Transcript_44065:2202-2669(-)
MADNEFLRFPDEEEIAELRDLFLMYDHNGDGSIQTSELGQVLTRMGQPLSVREVQSMINEIDQDGNGSMEFPEFLTMMIRKEVGFDIEDSIKKAFKSLDTENTGKIPMSQLEEIMKGQGEDISDEQLREIMEKTGSLGASEVDYNFFINAVLARV